MTTEGTTTTVITGDELRALRIKTGISLAAMARQIGCTPEQLACIELGVHPVNITVAVTVIRTVLEASQDAGHEAATVL